MELGQLGTIDTLIFSFYIVAVIAFGVWIANREKTETASDYFLASRSLPWWAVGGSLIASNISAEQIIGMNGSGFELGLAIATYELMPQTRLAAIVEQVREAARHLAWMAPELGADPARFTVSGHSAGAHLASLLAAKAPGDAAMPDLPPIKAMLLASGIYDLTGIPGSFLKDEAEMREDEAAGWSPLAADHLAGPLRVITRGAVETAPFQEQAEALAALLGPEAELRQEAGHNHLSIVLDLGDTAAPLGARLAEMVAAS